jgi:hypothetical protein
MPPYRTPESFGQAKTQRHTGPGKAPMMECTTCKRREGVVRRFTQGKYRAHMTRFH